MKHLIRFFPLIAGLGFGQAQDVTGDWLGTLSMPPRELRLALHITKDASGLKGTLDSVGQGFNGVPLDAVKLADSTLTFELNSLQVSFDGKVDAAAAVIDGTISSQEGSIPLTLRRGTIARAKHKPAKPSDIDGDWTGTLEGQEYLFHIANTEDGLVVAMDLESQHIRGAEASSVKRDAASVSMEWKVFGSRFDAKIAEDKSSMEGTVTQAGNSLPFTLKRAKP